MKLLYTYTLYNYSIKLSARKKITIEDRTIIFRLPYRKEKLTDCIVCELQKNITPNKKVLKVFEDLSNNIVPQGSKISKSLLRDKTHIKENHIPRLDEMPIFFQNYINAQKGNIAILLREFFKILKWKYNIHGSVKISARNNWFRIFGKDHSLPHDITAQIKQIGIINLNNIDLREIKSYIKKESLPISYDLILNIHTLANHDIRAAYIQCYSALEICIKEFLSFLIPNIDKLFFDIPSPPISTILKRVNGIKLKNAFLKSGLFSKKLRREISTITEKRNNLIHKGKITSKNDLEKSIKIMLDSMYLIYYYQGHNRALNNISNQFVEKYLDASFEIIN